MNSSVSHPRKQDPLHGVTLERLVTSLVERYGWEALGRMVPINCFTNEPSISSSLKFLRRTPWAREKVEALYLQSVRESADQGAITQEPSP